MEDDLMKEGQVDPNNGKQFIHGSFVLVSHNHDPGYISRNLGKVNTSFGITLWRQARWQREGGLVQTNPVARFYGRYIMIDRTI